MTKLVSLEGEREKRKGHCEYCGKDEHPEALMCPRITSIIYHQDDGKTVAVEVCFGCSDEPPKLAG